MQTQPDAHATPCSESQLSSGPAPGRRVTDHIVLERRLGGGSMGSVWVARHESLDTEVAVKLIGHLPGIDPRHLHARFQIEARAAAAIKSPHVASMFDHGVMDDGTPFIVMELLEGESLGARIARGRLPVDQVLAVARQVGRALTAAHASGVIHRDIKPDNIFLCRDGDGFFVKLLDFGIARQERRRGVTMPGQIVGTPEYMSPEQFDEAGVDAATDVWALGVVVYEMLTGTVPFAGETIGQLLLATTLPPPSLRAHRPELPEAIDAWFARACAPVKANRFGSAASAVRALEDVLSFAPREPARAQAQLSSLTPRRRRVTLATALIMAALLVVVVGASLVVPPVAPVAASSGDDGARTAATARTDTAAEAAQSTNVAAGAAESAGGAEGGAMEVGGAAAGGATGQLSPRRAGSNAPRAGVRPRAAVPTASPTPPPAPAGRPDYGF